MRKLLSLFLFLMLPLFGEDAPPFATCWVAGQLGNEMCQISATLAYAWDHGLEPIFPELNKQEWNISFNRDHFFFRLNPGPLPRKPKAELKGGMWWNYNLFPSGQDVYLKGIFFNKNYFHHHLDRLREVYAPSPSVLRYLDQKYGWLIDHPRTCSVHVRTFNKESVEKKTCIFLGTEYYRKAMALFPKGTLFVFFSDRIQWCKVAFADFPYDMVFVEGNNHVQDFHLMGMMQDHIIANSEFSWWASYLDAKSTKRIVAPRQWYRQGRGPAPYDDDTIHFPDWTILDVEINAPYPDDMRDYDPFSTSTDTQ